MSLPIEFYEKDWEYVSDPRFISAARAGNADEVIALLAAGVNVDGVSKANGGTALTFACMDGHADVVTVLLGANAKVNMANGFGLTPLVFACRRGHTEVVTKLLAANASVDQADSEGETPLYAACHAGHLSVVERLLAANASVEWRAKKGRTPLFAACKAGCTFVAERLLAANAMVDQADAKGRTPLNAACRARHTAVVMALLAANAMVDQGDRHGVTPLYAACLKCKRGTAPALIVAALLEANASVNQRGHNGASPLFVACHEGGLVVVQLLSSYGARRTFPFAPPCRTAEQFAQEMGKTKVAASLRLSRHWSPLHHLEVLTRQRATSLLRAGADVNQPACKPASPVRGVTPLQRARFLCSSGRGHGHAGSAAHAVLAHGAPWTRKTHRFYPPKVRARVAELMVIGQRFKRADRFLLELWEAFVIPHLVAADVWRHWRSIELGPDDSTEG